MPVITVVSRWRGRSIGGDSGAWGQCCGHLLRGVSPRTALVSSRVSPACGNIGRRIACSATGCQTASWSLWLRSDLLQALNHQPFPPWPQWVLLKSLSWSIAVNCIPLQTLRGLGCAASASPASPANPDTLSRYLSVSGPTENDEYSAEYHWPVFRLI